MMRRHEMKISDKRLWNFRKPPAHCVNSGFQQIGVNEASGGKPAREERLQAFNFSLLQAFIEMREE
jgi:hypothetical protein